jgi:hypothetical protein
MWPFQRLARTHALMAAGDAAMYGALAGSVLLGVAPDAQRPRVLLYLLVSAAPFAVVAPLIGPMVDRISGGRRMVVRLTAFARMLLYGLIAFHADDLWLYPLVFAVLVAQKTYAVSKSALVPAVVRNETELVEANSKLGLVSAVVGALAVGPCAALGRVSVVVPLGIGIAALLAASWQARYLPRDAVVVRRLDAPERALLRSHSVRRAAVAMVMVRASIGFLTFHLFFWLRDDYGLVAFGAAAASGTLGSVLGNVVAPRLRRRTREEVMVMVALATIAAALLLAAAVNFAGSVGRMAFDSIVQREAPDANQSRAFARFETRFQLAWVLACLPPVAFTLPGRVGFAVVAALGGAALTLQWLAGRVVRARGGRSRGPARRSRPASATRPRGPAGR